MHEEMHLKLLIVQYYFDPVLHDLFNGFSLERAGRELVVQRQKQ